MHIYCIAVGKEVGLIRNEVNFLLHLHIVKNRFAVNDDFTCLLPEHSRHHPKHRALARSVGSDQAKHRIFPDRHAHIIHCPDMIK